MPELSKHKCAKCGAAYDEAQWHQLSTVERIEPTEVRKIVRGWPDGTFIEIRMCRRYAALIARREAPQAATRANDS